MYQLTPLSGHGCEHAGLLNYGSPHLRNTCTPGYHFSPETSGWFHNSDGTYAIDWENPEVQDKVRETVDFDVKG